MTPEEKSKILYVKYDALFKAPYKIHSQIKECALIAANEIIEHIKKGADLGGFKQQYWKDVINEIKAL